MKKRVSENSKASGENKAARNRSMASADGRAKARSGVGQTSAPAAQRVSGKSAAKKLLAKGHSLLEGDGDASQYVYEGQTLMPGQSNRVMRFAVTFSIIFHVALLMVKFADPVAINQFIRTSSLEVLLVNAATQEEPSEAKFVAQSNVRGGENTANEGMYATSPYDYSPIASPGDSHEDTIQRQNEAREENMRQLTTIKEQFSLMPPIDPSWGENDPRRIAEEERRRLLSDRIAAIEQKIREENSRPRRVYIGPEARSHVQAIYYDSIRKKIEIKGTESFPQHNGMPMYGNLLMEVSVNPEGALVKAAILESSGNAVLDRQAQAIAASAGPFPPAPPELLRVERNIEFVFIMRFKFLNEGKVETELLERVNPQRGR